MALYYNNNGTVSEVTINAIMDGKVTSSIATAPTVVNSAATGPISSSNFTYQTTTTLSSVTPTPAAFGAVSANSASMAKYPSKTQANFAYNLTTPTYQATTAWFNSNFNHNNMLNTAAAVTTNIWDIDYLRGFVTKSGEPVDEFPGGGTGAVTFDGVSQYFTALNSEVVSWLPGTGDFTIEFFIKNGTQTVGAPRVFSLGFDTGATIGISIEGGYVYVWPYGSSLRGSLPASYNNGTAWMHVAICRSGTTTKLYMNGTLKATKTGDTRNINDSINPGYDLNVGVDNPLAMSPNWWAGKLTNFRWDNSAIYTSSSLVVPTAPLTATATTKLLMLGGGVSNPVYDAAKLNHLVNNGSVWDAETPFV